MDRRAFFAFVPLGAVAVRKVAAEPVDRGGVEGGVRVSTKPGDPGERLYAQLCGDHLRFKVYLDDVEQRGAVTADERLGMVRRVVFTERGNIAFNMATSEAFEEEVYGKVRVEWTGRGTSTPV